MGHMSDTKVGDLVEIIRCYDAYTETQTRHPGHRHPDRPARHRVHVRWDDGRNLGLVPGQDEWRVIHDEESPEAQTD